MDSDSDATPGQLSPQPSLTAYHRGATDVGVTTTTTSSPPTSWTSTPRLHSQSRNNLRQASVALDTAYERITSLRNSINNMLNRIPPEVAGTGTPTSSTDTSDTQPPHSLAHDANIRPPHSALMLSGEQAVEELNVRAARLRSLISPSARQRLEEFESNRGDGRRESAWDRFSQNDRPRIDRSDIHPVPLRPRTPPMPDLVLPRTGDLVDPPTAQTRRRDLSSTHQDDSSTMIGRRVAARVNAPSSHGSLSSRLSLSQIEQRLQVQTAQVARELENMTEQLNAQRSRRVELASSWVRGDNAAAPAQDNGATSPSRVASATASGDLWPNPPAGGRPLRPARNVTLIDSTRIVLPQPISRTSSDGAPIEELSAPARRSLSAAFREHIAYRDNTQSANMNTSQDTTRSLTTTALEARGTLANLLTRDRDDQVRSARQTEYTRTGVDTSRGNDTLVHSNSLVSGGPGRRRRGWTRLNADGDEIDSDEDDSVSPHTRRLRMRLAYGTPSTDQPATRSHTVTIEDILWRTSGSDSEADALSPDSTESCSSLFQGSPPRPPVCCPYPLPTPVEDMVTFSTTKPAQQPRVICVSEYASLAGR